MKKEIIHYVSGEDDYSFLADENFDITIEENRLFLEAKNVEIRKNGEAPRWYSGYFSSQESLMKAVSLYVNGGNINISYVDEKIRNVYELINSDKTEEGINQKCISREGYILDLDFATKDNVGYSQLHTEGWLGEVAVLETDKTISTESRDYYKETVFKALEEGTPFIYKSENIDRFAAERDSENPVFFKCNRILKQMNQGEKYETVLQEEMRDFLDSYAITADVLENAFEMEKWELSHRLMLYYSEDFKADGIFASAFAAEIKSEFSDESNSDAQLYFAEDNGKIILLPVVSYICWDNERHYESLESYLDDVAYDAAANIKYFDDYDFHGEIHLQLFNNAMECKEIFELAMEDYNDLYCLLKQDGELDEYITQAVSEAREEMEYDR